MSATTALSTPREESMPLLHHFQDKFAQGYSTESHVTIEPNGHGIMEYDAFKLSTFRVLTAVHGSVLSDPVLFTEQLILTVIFFLFSCPTLYFFDVRFELLANQTLNHSLDGQEDKMRAFTTIMTTLATFLLAFYTSITVTRWWTIRTQGVGGIKAAAMELEMYVSELVTKEEVILSAIRRYARASLMLIFLWRRKEMGDMRKILVSKNVLAEDEVDQLLHEEWNHNLHESIWTWQVSIIVCLYKERKIKSDKTLCFLLERCSQGRAAVQLIATHLAVQIPMQYVHLLCWLVKLHNVILATILGILFGKAVQENKHILCVQLVGRTILMPLLFNAILLINAELSDPFDGGVSDFPGMKYDNAIENDGQSFKKAAMHLPAWLRESRKGEEAA